MSALCQAVVLTGFLRAPVLAEEPASPAVHRALLAENIHVAAPAMVAVPPIVDTVFAEEPPGDGPVAAGALRRPGAAGDRSRLVAPEAR